MRNKTFLLTLTALFYLLPVMAQKEESHPDFIVRLGISGAPSVAAEYYYSGLSSSFEYGTMESVYRDRSGGLKTFGTIIAGLDIKFNRVIAVSFDLGFNALWTDRFSGITGDKTGVYKSYAIYFVPKAKLYYMDRPIVRMYGSIGIGIGKYFGNILSGTLFKNPYTFELQFVPYGIEVGKKLFGFAELGAGTMYLGIHAGIGYKF